MKECPACRRCFSDEINHCPQDGDATTPSLLGEPILDARYQLERRLGQGGMGVVFQARHIFLKTSHAIKVILPDLVGNDPMLVTRFRQEALAAAAIRHQNIIAVTDFGVVRGTMPFLVMEFVNGKSLQEVLAEEKVMDPTKALEYACAIGAGVGAAHRQNIVHRDLKPLNIMMQQGMPVAEGLKILDFGLAKIKSGELLGSFVQAKTSGLMGSPFYMAPEQWSDEEPDARADVYSLGIILYQMLTGDVPFKGSSIPSIMKKHLTLPPPTFKSTGIDVAPRLEAVVRHALEKEVSARTKSVEEFIKELREAAAAGPLVVQSEARGRPVADETVYAPAIGTSEAGRKITAEPVVETPKLTPEEQAKLAAEREAYEKEQREKERVARELLDREAAERKNAEEEKQRKQKEQEELKLKEEQEREDRERQRREQMERVERQAKELEERLARLAVSMPPTPGVGVVDPEATQVHQSLKGATSGIGNNSFPPGAATGDATIYDSATPGFSVTIPPKPKSNALMMVGIAVVLVVLVGGAIAAYFALHSKTIITDPPASPTPVASPGSIDGIKADLVEIPGGTFTMGRDDGPAAEAPKHSATVPSFFMDKTEVTNAEYADFVRDAHHTPPQDWNDSTKPPHGTEQWPVVFVSLDDVAAFASWRSKRDKLQDNLAYRLPTEEEWEYAARNGDRSDLYPWGTEWKDKHAWLKDTSPTSVGSLPDGKNKWGVSDLIGNVWEWTSSKVSAYPGNPTTIPTATKEWLIIRGAGYNIDPKNRDTPATSCLRSWVPPTTKDPRIGFRLVRSAQ
ncbi:MAG TPA: SUMF1/EgtB/PvdO family nonheme iron enzyme [Pyrinomonadaceae bacterium]|nr:SUMF1/EgtB/PvdO family nonheme iron enzyme [Pyrinomonadaceae bacterium]